MKEIVTMEREMLSKYQLDALVTMSPENITYITGAYIPTQVTVRSRKVIHIMTRNADPVVIVVNIEEPIMRAQSWMAQESIISYNEFTQNPVLIAIEKLKELGVESGRLGFEMSYVSANDAALLRRELPHAEIVDADPVFEEMRFIKLDFELQRIIELGSRIEDVIYSAFAHVRAGMTEKDIYRCTYEFYNDFSTPASPTASATWPRATRWPCPWWAPAGAAVCSTGSPRTRSWRRATSCGWT